MKRVIREDRVTHASAIISYAIIRLNLYNEMLRSQFTIAKDIECYARAKNRGYEALIIGLEEVLHIANEKWGKGRYSTGFQHKAV